MVSKCSWSNSSSRWSFFSKLISSIILNFQDLPGVMGLTLVNLMEFLSASKAGKVNLLYFKHRNWMFWPVRDFRSEEHEAKRSFRRGCQVLDKSNIAASQDSLKMGNWGEWLQKVSVSLVREIPDHLHSNVPRSGELVMLI